jgi:hypothetical protein
MTLHVLNPVSRKVQESLANAQRLTSLDGRRIGLYWNHKPGGDIALKRTRELLESKFPGLQTTTYVGSVGGAYHQVTKGDVERIARECVAVVGTTAD